jgi:hypothetical protein
MIMTTVNFAVKHLWSGIHDRGFILPPRQKTTTPSSYTMRYLPELVLRCKPIGGRSHANTK